MHCKSVLVPFFWLDPKEPKGQDWIYWLKIPLHFLKFPKLGRKERLTFLTGIFAATQTKEIS